MLQFMGQEKPVLDGRKWYRMSFRANLSVHGDEGVKVICEYDTACATVIIPMLVALQMGLQRDEIESFKRVRVKVPGRAEEEGYHLPKFDWHVTDDREGFAKFQSEAVIVDWQDDLTVLAGHIGFIELWDTFAGGQPWWGLVPKENFPGVVQCNQDQEPCVSVP